MIEYVLLFAFDWRDNGVLLVKKSDRGPSGSQGWNGLGGKLNSLDEEPPDAAEREFFEETGVRVPHDKWVYFAEVTASCDGYILHCFTKQLVRKDSDAMVLGDNPRAGGELKFLSQPEYHSVIEAGHCAWDIHWLLPLAHAASRRLSVEHFLRVTI